MKSQAKERTSLHRRVAFAAAGALALSGAVACAANVDEKPKEQEVAAKDLSADQSARAHRHYRSPVNIIIDAARAKADLTPAQASSLTTIEAELRLDHESKRELGKRLKKSAIAVVRSGDTNSKDFEQSVSEALSAMEERMQQKVDAAEEIHGTLDESQRAAVATVLRAEIDKKFGPRPEADKRRKDGIKKFTAQLMLSTFQVDKLKAIKKEMMGEKERLRPTRAELNQLVDAFEGEDFRTALNAYHAKKVKVLRQHFADAGQRTDTILSVFTPEQRALMADMIQEGPKKVMLGEKVQPAIEK